MRNRIKNELKDKIKKLFWKATEKNEGLAHRKLRIIWGRARSAIVWVQNILEEKKKTRMKYLKK